MGEGAFTRKCFCAASNATMSSDVPFPLLTRHHACTVPLLAQTQPDLLLINGKIWTVNPAQKEAQAVAVGGNHILAVGTNDEILKWKRDTSQVIDLHGRRVVPGFNDSHVHFYAGGTNLAGVQLRALKSPEAFRDAIGAFSKTLPRGNGSSAAIGTTKIGLPRNCPPANSSIRSPRTARFL